MLFRRHKFVNEVQQLTLLIDAYYRLWKHLRFEDCIEVIAAAAAVAGQGADPLSACEILMTRAAVFF